MIPYGHQFLNKSDIEAVVKVLKSDWLTQGPKITEFEEKLAKYCGAKFAVLVNNGTAALHLAYLAAGLKSGDEVITTPNTFVATTNMMLAVGAKPVFCDIRLDTNNIDETKIERKINSKTRAIVPVHFAGHPCEMNKILQIAKKRNLVVIEDACHALGAEYYNRKIGSLKSDMTIFSFHPVKTITTGEGGAIVTNNKKYYEKLKLLRSHGIYKDKQGKNVMIALGYNYRATDFQAALGISQLKKITFFIKEKHRVAKKYLSELAHLNDIILPKELLNNFSAWHIFVIRLKDKQMRDPLMQYLKKNGVGVNFHYPAVYSHPFYKKNKNFSEKLKNEEIYHHSCITLPCFPLLTDKEISFISKLIINFFSKK